MFDTNKIVERLWFFLDSNKRRCEVEITHSKPFKVLHGTIGSNKPLWNKYSTTCEPSGAVFFNICSITPLPVNVM